MIGQQADQRPSTISRRKKKSDSTGIQVQIMAAEARMSVEMQESIQRTYAKAKELRPKNTTRSYDKP
ncbi:hypothetical protein GN244_ATG02590 [Phytophthora infestans]|uniref:Uncharacterized protein n=1 Tax=Phytophthora infestans TaxID=4787 RepID=A0A833TRA0_PHYIN|nr:hypothetical protein GN244_ATG02590 [Phytophthora infestans]